MINLLLEVYHKFFIISFRNLIHLFLQHFFELIKLLDFLSNLLLDFVSNLLHNLFFLVILFFFHLFLLFFIFLIRNAFFIIFLVHFFINIYLCIFFQFSSKLAILNYLNFKFIDKFHHIFQLFSFNCHLISPQFILILTHIFLQNLNSLLFLISKKLKNQNVY